MARETAAQKAAREWAETRTIAEAAGYVDPYPVPGTAPVLTIWDRCSNERCRWSMYVSLMGEVWCPNPKCAEHHKVYAPVEEDESDGQPVPAAQP